VTKKGKGADGIEIVLDLGVMEAKVSSIEEGNKEGKG